MGNSASAPTGDDIQHVFKSSTTPTKLSASVQDSLQKSPESDHSRSSRQESIIQARVAEELRALSGAASKALHEAEDRNSSSDSPSSSSDSKSSSASKELNRAKVSKAIDDLRKKLSERRLEEVDEDVERARDSVVKCLRLNDRRPLDCWREVEDFKTEVRKLEGRFVEKALN